MGLIKMRRGLGKNLGKGYKNLVPLDSHVHSLSAKGLRTYVLSTKYYNINSKKEYRGNAYVTVKAENKSNALKKLHKINKDDKFWREQFFWDEPNLTLDAKHQQQERAKGKQYKVVMTNEDNGHNKQILFKGSLEQCRNFLKEETKELKEDSSIDIFNATDDWVEGEGHRGAFEYKINGKSVSAYSCACGFMGTKGEFGKHKKHCKVYLRDMEAQKQLYAKKRKCNRCNVTEYNPNKDFKCAKCGFVYIAELNAKSKSKSKLLIGHEIGYDVYVTPEGKYLRYYGNSKKDFNNPKKWESLNAKGIANAEIYYSKRVFLGENPEIYDQLRISSDKETVEIPAKMFKKEWKKMSKDKVMVDGKPIELERMWSKYNDSGYATDKPYSKGKNPLATPKGQEKVRKSGTGHTSMSMGDVVKVGDEYYIASAVGFKKVNLI